MRAKVVSLTLATVNGDTALAELVSCRSVEIGVDGATRL